MKQLAMILGAVAITASSAASAQVAPDAQRTQVKLQLAHQIVEAGGGQKAAEAQIRALYGSIGKLIAQNLPADQSSMSDVFQHDLQDEMLPIVPQLIDISEKEYVAVYTEQELRDLLAFETSESGRSISRKRPLLLQRTLADMGPLFSKMLPNIMRKTADRVCAETHCTPQQQQMVAQALSKSLPAS